MYYVSVMKSIESKIKTKLQELELKHGIQILYAVESGSRLWGFESVDSDYDVRFIYVRPLQWYLSVRSRRDVIEFPISEDLDFSGWDMKKALYLLSKSNPPFLEWLNSHIIYKETDVVEKIKKMVASYFNPRATIFHYLHMVLVITKNMFLKEKRLF